jgi:integrase
MQTDSRSRRPVLDSKGQRVKGLWMKAGRYVAGYKEPGTGRWRMVALEAATLTAAKRERESLLASLREQRRAASSDETWDAIFEEWLASRGAAKRTIDHDRHLAGRHLAALSGRRVQNITTRDLARVLLGMRGRYAEWTRYSVYRIAKATFALALLRGLINRSPVDGLSGAEIPAQRNAKQVAVLDAERLDRLVMAAATSRWRALLGCAAYAGLRLGEIRALRWRDVDVENGVIRVRASMLPDGTLKETKTAAGVRSVTLFPLLRRLLREWQLASPRSRPSDFVFCTVAGKPLAERNIRRALDYAKREAKLDTLDDRLSMHALRHSFLSLAATTLDVPDTTLARMAGHANPAITMRLYARDRRDQDRVNEDVLARAAQAGFAS